MNNDKINEIRQTMINFYTHETTVYREYKNIIVIYQKKKIIKHVFT
jgi:hypothetical protein